MENILYNSTISYHGIRNDIFKMISILEHGILSTANANNIGIELNRNYLGYNKDNYVSLSESPCIQDTFNHGAFKLFVKEGISFVINTSKYNAFRDRGYKGQEFEHDINLNSGIIGEIYIEDGISKEDIIGIMVPQEILQKPISDVTFGFGGMGKELIDKYISNVIKMIAVYFNYEIYSEIVADMLREKQEIINLNMDLLEKLEREEKIIDDIDHHIMKNLSKAVSIRYGIENPTFGFLINIYNINKLPLYDTEGKLIETEKQQTK